MEENKHLLRVIYWCSVYYFHGRIHRLENPKTVSWKLLRKSAGLELPRADLPMKEPTATAPSALTEELSLAPPPILILLCLKGPPGSYKGLRSVPGANVTRMLVKACSVIAMVCLDHPTTKRSPRNWSLQWVTAFWDAQDLNGRLHKVT